MSEQCVRSPAAAIQQDRPFKSRSSLDSIRFACDGMAHVLHTHRHIRTYFVITGMVIATALVLRVTKVEWLFLFMAIGLVFVAELVNTAVEALVDLITDRYHPLARVAKDVAGAAVLAACAVSVLVGGVVFLDQPGLHAALSAATVEATPHNAIKLAVMGLALVSILVTLGKVRGRTGTILRGGVISGHAALSAFLATAVYYVTGRNLLVLVLVSGLTLLVCQSRVDAGIHSIKEVILGVALAVLIGVLLFQFVP